MTFTQIFTITLNYPLLIPLLLFFFFPLLDHIRLSCRLRPCHTFFLQNHLLLFTFGRTLVYCPVVDFSFEHLNIFKEIIYSKSGMAV